MRWFRFLPLRCIWLCCWHQLLVDRFFCAHRSIRITPVSCINRLEALLILFMVEGLMLFTVEGVMLLISSLKSC